MSISTDLAIENIMASFVHKYWINWQILVMNLVDKDGATKVYIPEKCIMRGSVQVLPNQVSKQSFSIRMNILTSDSSMQSYIQNRVKLWELIQFKG